jgi:hypothetical protein
MGGSKKENLRKTSNGCSHVRLEKFNKNLYGRFTNNVLKSSLFVNKNDYDFCLIDSDKLVLATDDILLFKNVDFFFSVNVKDNKPESVRIWYWDTAKQDIDEIYKDAKLQGKFYCAFSPEYEDFPIDNNAKEYATNYLYNFYVDWRVYGRHERKFSVDIFENGKLKETVCFGSIKDFINKYFWTKETISHLLDGKIPTNKTRVKIINGKRYILKRLSSNSLIMEIMDHNFESNNQNPNTLDHDLEIKETKTIESEKPINSIDHNLEPNNQNSNTLDHNLFHLGSGFNFSNCLYYNICDLKIKSSKDHDLGIKSIGKKGEKGIQADQFPINRIKPFYIYFPNNKNRSPP